VTKKIAVFLGCDVGYKPEDGGSTFLRIADNILRDYTAV
jgi:hypothetical protein